MVEQEFHAIISRLKDLAKQSEARSCYLFSPFLSLGEQDAFLREVAPALGDTWSMFGGYAGTERQMLRFGSPRDLGYAEDFPILCLRISALNPRFAEPFTHRDILGATLHLGVDRGVIGDIVLRPEGAYVFAASHMKDFLLQELTQVKHTAVQGEVVETLPEGELFRLESKTLLVSSLRLDGLIAHAYRLSRSDAAELFRRGYVFVNGRLCSRPDRTFSPGDLVSVRHQGRFRLGETQGESRKGRLYVEIAQYV